MKIVAEMWVDLGDAGQHQATIVGFVREDDVLVNSVTIEPLGGPEIDLWPLLKSNGMAEDVEQALIGAADAKRESAAEAMLKATNREMGIA